LISKKFENIFYLTEKKDTKRGKGHESVNNQETRGTEKESKKDR
jgi:hypothetical protein